MSSWSRVRWLAGVPGPRRSPRPRRLGASGDRHHTRRRPDGQPGVGPPQEGRVAGSRTSDGRPEADGRRRPPHRAPVGSIQTNAALSAPRTAPPSDGRPAKYATSPYIIQTDTNQSGTATTRLCMDGASHSNKAVGIRPSYWWPLGSQCTRPLDSNRYSWFGSYGISRFALPPTSTCQAMIWTAAVLPTPEPPSIFRRPFGL